MSEPNPDLENHRIYILGAGFSGLTINKEIQSKGILGQVEAFLDDDPAKIGSDLDGVPVLGPIDVVLRILQPKASDEALIAMPSAPVERIRSLHMSLKRCGFPKIRILPAVSQILEGDAHLIQTRDLDPQDLLSRPPVNLGLKQSLQYLRGKRVLITGAGGSIGSELARQLLLGGAERLYLLGHGENSIYQIDRELRLLQSEGIGERATIVPIIGELQDEDYLRFLLPRLHLDVIFHAAAYKHVPMMEANPIMAIKNNVFGTHFLVKTARECGVKRFVLISTDKVVNPRSIYGASKKLSEAVVIDEFKRAGPDQRFMAVRFGNVLGSRGSIVPLFKEQILNGGPVTVTHPDATRFFMTIPEAASLVLKAGGVGENGKLYLLNMGEPLVIAELARQMIRFYGFEPDRDIKLNYIGLREGEKVFEALHENWETVIPTDHDRIQELQTDHSWLACEGGCAEILDRLRPLCFKETGKEQQYRNRRVLRDVLRLILPSLPEKPEEAEF